MRWEAAGRSPATLRVGRLDGPLVRSADLRGHVELVVVDTVGRSGDRRSQRATCRPRPVRFVFADGAFAGRLLDWANTISPGRAACRWVRRAAGTSARGEVSAHIAAQLTGPKNTLESNLRAIEVDEKYVAREGRDPLPQWQADGRPCSAAPPTGMRRGPGPDDARHRNAPVPAHSGRKYHFLHILLPKGNDVATARSRSETVAVRLVVPSRADRLRARGVLGRRRCPARQFELRRHTARPAAALLHDPHSQLPVQLLAAGQHDRSTRTTRA